MGAKVTKFTPRAGFAAPLARAKVAIPRSIRQPLSLLAMWSPFDDTQSIQFLAICDVKDHTHLHPLTIEQMISNFAMPDGSYAPLFYKSNASLPMEGSR
ncbi:MAG: hypothetical protein FJ335_05610 [Sphingomonadales bacterium]|nr:hypothetical protein [Sphingomonadales bacterium]